MSIGSEIVSDKCTTFDIARAIWTITVESMVVLDEIVSEFSMTRFIGHRPNLAFDFALHSARLTDNGHHNAKSQNQRDGLLYS